MKNKESLITKEHGYNSKARETENQVKQKNEIQSKTQEKIIQQQVHNKQPKIENDLDDINIKQEVNLNTRVNDMKNLGQVLDREVKMPKLDYGDSPAKIGIVESDDLKKLTNDKGEKEQGHSSRYEAVIITKKGKVKALNLENDTQEGTNPRENNYQVKQNGEIENDDVLTRLKVGKGTIGIDKGKYGEVEVFHSPRKTIGGKGVEGNKSLDRQLETSNSKNTLQGTDIDTLQLDREYGSGYRSVEEGYQEVEKHKEKHENCEPKDEKDIDGELNTASHSHQTEEYVELSNGEKVTYKELASRWGFYKEGQPDAAFVKEKFEQKEQGDKKAEDVIAEMDEEYEDPRIQQDRNGR